MKLVTELWETVQYDRHTHTYSVRPKDEILWSVVGVENLCDHPCSES